MALAEGLTVQENNRQHVVMSSEEIAEDVLATLSKLKVAASRGTFGRRWKQRRRKNGVDMFELIPRAGDDPDDDPDIAHAMVAKTELRCHLNEVLNVLINQASSDYEASMQSLCGSEFKQGKVLFSQSRKLSGHKDADGDPGASKKVLVGVQLATLTPKPKFKLQTTHKRTQQLCFSSYTHQNLAKDRAIHLIKTIPKEAHDQVVPSQDRCALRREIDHIATGFDIQSKHGGYGAASHATRIFLHTYASTVPPSQFGHTSSRQPGVLPNTTELARRHEAVMNPEAHYVMDLLTKSLRDMETVIRRRRFGFQTFVYFPTMYDSETSEANCSICCKSFLVLPSRLFLSALREHVVRRLLQAVRCRGTSRCGAQEPLLRAVRRPRRRVCVRRRGPDGWSWSRNRRRR